MGAVTKMEASQATSTRMNLCILTSRLVATSDFPSSLLFDDVATFADHLKEKRDHITTSLQGLFSAIRSNSPNTAKNEKADELQSRLSTLLASEKAHKIEITRLQKEKEDANSRLTEATIKYMTAEKKVDRLKSQTLAKIERQAMFQSNAGAETGRDGSTSDEQSAKDQEISAKVAEGNVADAEQARKEAQAIASKQKEELQQLQTVNARLSDQVTTFTIKVLRSPPLGLSLKMKGLSLSNIVRAFSGRRHCQVRCVQKPQDQT